MGLYKCKHIYKPDQCLICELEKERDQLRAGLVNADEIISDVIKYGRHNGIGWVIQALMLRQKEIRAITENQNEDR